MPQRTFETNAIRRIPVLAAAVLASALLAACQHMPSTDAPPPPAASQPAASTGNAAGNGQEMVTVATVTMSCVPTKDAQALGLTQTEQVVATYKQPAQDDAGDSSMELAFDSKTYLLRQAPAASGSRYVTSDTLAPAHKGFSWHTKRNEAIIAALEPASGVEDVVDGTLLYRCLAMN